MIEINDLYNSIDISVTSNSSCIKYTCITRNSSIISRNSEELTTCKLAKTFVEKYIRLAVNGLCMIEQECYAKYFAGHWEI